MDWKREYLKSSVIIFAIIWGIISILLYEWIERILIIIENIMNYLFEGFLIILATPGYLLYKVLLKFVSIQNIYIQVIIGVIIAFMITPFIQKLFKLLFRVLFNKPLPRWMGGG